MPLRKAVNDRLTQLLAEQDRLLHDARSHTYRTPRYTMLANAGLSDTQIATIEPNALAPDVAIERRRARLTEILPIIANLRAFCSSISFDAAFLTGMSEFDFLVAERDGEKVTA
jgi:hypothetical protein